MLTRPDKVGIIGRTSDVAEPGLIIRTISRPAQRLIARRHSLTIALPPPAVTAYTAGRAVAHVDPQTAVFGRVLEATGAVVVAGFWGEDEVVAGVVAGVAVGGGESGCCEGEEEGEEREEGGGVEGEHFWRGGRGVVVCGGWVGM